MTCTHTRIVVDRWEDEDYYGRSFVRETEAEYSTVEELTNRCRQCGQIVRPAEQEAR